MAVSTIFYTFMNKYRTHRKKIIWHKKHILGVKEYI